MADDRLSTFRFRVEWGGASMGFTEVSGLDAKPEVTAYRDQSTTERSSRRIPGMRKYPNVTLKRGLFRSERDYARWQRAVSPTTAPRQDVVVTLLNEAGEAVRTWRIRNAMPVKIESADLNADGNEVAVESIELTHEGITD